MELYDSGYPQNSLRWAAVVTGITTKWQLESIQSYPNLLANNFALFLKQFSWFGDFFITTQNTVMKINTT